METYPNDVRPQSHIVNSRYGNSSYVMKNNGFEVHVSEWWNNGHTLLLLFNNDSNVTQQHSRLKSVKDAIPLMIVPISNRDIAVVIIGNHSIRDNNDSRESNGQDNLQASVDEESQ
ncbi:hypothetical protein RFI_39606 [Reticulomyxa filosa]|uniref:Uncharacterized protein n=1 Tax=Reticulomyxa filosa TaxID=46433 RepID=X6L9B6_RETFI|nr:hypothetical protein RFI_39606 [Reticulomyxa filosa]|eukprot:ETN97920.1 hypothetical protein RFI_39606 [Reticulomyxa filosa]